jgi:sialic acid synthase SpsE
MTKLIVELCQNYQGDRRILERTVEEAAAGGADYVKIQSMFADDLTNRDRFEEGETSADGVVTAIKRPYAAEKQRLSRLDLTLDDHRWFIDKCRECGVIPLTTIFARHRIPSVGALPWPERVVKVASYDCASWPMLEELAEYFDRLIISTGAMRDEEIQATAELMRRLGKSFSFLHCVTSYPNTLEMCHLARMEWLRTMAPEVGWSDHTLVERDGLAAAEVAIMLGADYVERHITSIAREDTKDGPISISPAQLKALDEFRRLPKEEQTISVERTTPHWRTLLGDAHRPMSHTELLNRDYYRGRFASPDEQRTWIYNWQNVTRA